VKEVSGLILYDQGQVIPKEGLNVRQIGIPATQSALRKLKNKQVANIVFLGALIEITKLVSARTMRKAIGTHVSERFKDLNLKALQLGLTLGRGVQSG
jgi:2-oxoglutarate ferredoxin oxidoreductase subunit gamma